MDCIHASRFIHAYVDGEFSDDDRAEMDKHLQGCQGCRSEALGQARFKSALRARVERTAVPERLQQRVRSALAEEVTSHSWWHRLGWRLTPAVVAVGALGLLLVRLQPASPVVEQSILDHEQDWPVEVVGPDPEGVSTWFRGKLDVPVRPPHLGPDARLLGGRIGHVGAQHAAQLVYFVPGGHRVTVFVFNPEGLSMDEASHRVVLRDRPVYVGGERGYHVAMFRDRGVGYAVASDLDEDDMIQLVRVSFGGP